MSDAICVARKFNGIGDWLMSANCIKFVNRQRPDIRVYVDFDIPRGDLPVFVPQAFAASDLKYRSGKPRPGTRRTNDSLVYRKWPPENYIESMLLHLNEQTGLAIEYEPQVFPEFGVSRKTGDYIVMIGHGKRRHRHGKEWGFDNIAKLAEELKAAGYPIHQVGAAKDSAIPAARRRLLGGEFRDVARELAGALAYIGIENGIMVLAGFLGVPQATIYDGHSAPGRVDFEQHLQIAERINPRRAARQILEWLQQC